MDKVFNKEDNIEAEFLGFGSFYTKEYIELEAVERIIRGGEDKLDMITKLRRYQEKNRNIPVALLNIPDRLNNTAITINKFHENYEKLDKRH